MRYPELSMHHPEFNVPHPVLPLYSPCPLAAQFVPLLPDPSAAIPAQFVPLLPDPSAADNQALPYNPDQLTVCDLSAIPNFSECYPEFFTNTEYCEEVYVPQPAVASDVIESFVGNAPSQVQQAPPHPSPHARTRTPPTVRGSAFVPSDSYVQNFTLFFVAINFNSDRDILSSHEKKRLYVECLEHYVQCKCCFYIRCYIN
jgi:hypothetical protein